jgi:hypothetical protein
MLLSLVLYVSDQIRQPRFAHCKRSISILPCKSSHSSSLSMNPFRGICFNELCNLTGGQGCRSKNQCTNMIRSAAYLESRGFMLSRNATDILPYSLLNCRIYPGLAILGAENNRIMKRCVGIRHFACLPRIFSTVTT